MLYNYRYPPIILSGYSSQRRARTIAHHMGAEYYPLDYIVHNNEEIKPVVNGGDTVNFRNSDVIIIAGGTGAPNNIIFETQQLQSIARDGFANVVTTHVPNFPYGRQDNRFGERAPVGLVEAAYNCFNNSDVAVICDPHNANGTMLALAMMAKHRSIQYQPIHFATPFAYQIKYFIDQGVLKAENCMFMGLDKGGAERLTAEFIAAMRIITGISVPTDPKSIPYLDKKRDPNKGNQPKFTGAIFNASLEDMKGKDIIIPEDMIDTGGSALDGPGLLKHLGARSVTVLATNALLSASRIRADISLPGFDGTLLTIKRTDKNPDAAISVKKIDRRAAKGDSVDLILVSNNMDHALTDPDVARAVESSPVIHEVDGLSFTANILRAMRDPDRATNSVSHRLAGDPHFVGTIPFEPTPLKPGNRFLTMGR